MPIPEEKKGKIQKTRWFKGKEKVTLHASWNILLGEASFGLSFVGVLVFKKKQLRSTLHAYCKEER